MTLYNISDKEQRVITLASRGESRGGNNYDAVINDNDTYKGILTSMTLKQVRELQLNKLPSTGAVGRYQLIRKYYPNFVGDSRYAGFSDEEQSRIKFSPDIQDYIIIKIMKADYRLDQWLNESISSEDFQFQMARLFASVPVPRDMQGHNRFVKKGESYYAGDGLNAAKGSADSFLQELEAIRQGVDYVAKSVDTASSGNNGADPEQGVSNKRIAEYTTASGNRPTGGHKTRSNPNMKIELPKPENVYKDEPIDPHDNRYDFRTGKMVRDIGINGTYPISSNSDYTDRSYQSPGVASGADLTGVTSETAKQVGETVTNAPLLDTTDDARSARTSNRSVARSETVDTADDSRASRTNYTPTPSQLPDGVSGGSSVRRDTRSSSFSGVSSNQEVSTGSSSRRASRQQQKRSPIPPGNTKTLRPR